MNKNLLTISFSLLFLTSILVPTILVLVDDSIDISFVYDMSEEEEERGNESSKEFENRVVDLEIKLITFNTTEKPSYFMYTFKTYQKPHLNLIYSPPEFVF